ncbi:MAG TPA: ABC transporter ATP-binding protein [Rhabdochlamydiaceae bacterium]|jgi:zinc transport system ATP-binding protein|nr:ABC transporter ATP-binding protein [Rhabdochlamydiaceae bacterium]
MAIKSNNLFFQYEETPILENVSLVIAPGEFVGIFGPNGGGKTTLLKLLLGFLKPQKGSVEILGESTKFVREKMGYVPQISHLDRQFPITVLEVVMMGCLDKSPYRSYTKDAKEKAREALKNVGMLDFQNHSFGTLSGGQAQRVLIARALVSKPSILLLDEPTASVDAAAEETIYNLLQQLKGTMTIVMVTHDLQVMMQKVDRFICVNKEVTSYSQTQVCDHFAQGLYHPPLRRP